MRLVSYSRAGERPDRRRAGVLVGDRVVDAGGDRPAVREILAGGPAARRELAARADAADGVPLDELVLGPPVPDPEKILCLGLNYRAHVDELDLAVPPAPILFPKFRNCLIGPDAAIRLPAASRAVDYEGELALVIGRRCKDVAERDAMSVVAGYMPMNDVSARDLQMQTGQWTAGKAIDTFAPCGPALVTADEIADPHALELVTRVNGVELQRASTALMIFSIPEIIAFVSSLITLEVGDVIATGTPAGVGTSRIPPVFLADGDEVEVEIGGVGRLRNPVVAGARYPGGVR